MPPRIQPAGSTRKSEQEPRGLPPALRPWAAAFANMPEAHILLVGRLMAAVAPLVETADNALRDGIAELESLDDIAPAGPLERLLVSELVWLKLLPGEFARRIAEGEALRRRPVYRDRADDRAVLVVVDSGSQMLGRRRLLALAVLLTLGAAAHRRGDRFLWTSTAFMGDAPWQDGLSRRGLSRFINQTGAEGLGAKALDRLLQVAPVDPSDEAAVVWTIAPKNNDFGEFAPQYRFEIDEIWSRSKPADGAGALRYAAEMTVTSNRGSRTTARVAFPEEQICADVLRAPFRARPVAGDADHPTGWAPSWIAPEADGNAAYFRDDRGIAIYRRYAPRLRVNLVREDHLLGVRSPASGQGAVVWRQGSEIHVVRFDGDGAISRRGSTTLADDHPLIAQSHPDPAVPPLLRFGKKAAMVVGAPDGRMFDIAFLQTVDDGRIAVSAVQQTQDLRILARTRTWLLSEREKYDPDILVLANARDGRRITLRNVPSISRSNRVRQCAVIGETGGALVALKDGWHWLYPTSWSDFDSRRPPVARNAFLLRIDPHQHERASKYAGNANRRSWAAWFWSQAAGLEQYFFDGEAWSCHSRHAPPLPGRVVAMTLLGRNVFALSRGDGGGNQLVEFRFKGAAPAKVLSGPCWWEEATCVML